MEQVERSPRGMVWKIVVTIVTLTAFLVGTLIFVGFYTGGYSLLQKIVVFLIGFILSIAAVSIMWVAWKGGEDGIHDRWGP